MALPTPSRESTCLITGASSGIGADIARSLARRGHGVTLVARRTELLEKLAEELRAGHGVRAEVLAADLLDPATRGELVERVAALGLTVDVLVNNAGFGSAGNFQQLPVEREVDMVRLNVETVVELCGRYVPEMVGRGRGALLNVASTAAFQPLPRQATYAASKAFVLSFTDALSVDLSGTGVTAASLCPGPVRTEFFENAGFESEARDLPGFVWTTPDFVAEEGVRALERGRRVAVPGGFNRLSALSGQHTPRGAWLKLAGRFYPVGRD
jgi:hypothetical protein